MTMILVTSPKGGVGVTTVVAEIARRLAARGGDVVAIDLGDQPSLGYRLGEGAATDDDSGGGARHTVRFHQVQPAVARGSARARFALDLRGQGAMLIVDIAAGDTETRDALLAAADLVICVLAADAGSLALLPQAVELAGVIPYCVLNRVDERRALAIDAVTVIGDVFGTRLIGTVREDEAVNEALARLGEIADGSAAATDFTALTVRVADILHAVAVSPPLSVAVAS